MYPEPGNPEPREFTIDPIRMEVISLLGDQQVPTEVFEDLVERMRQAEGETKPTQGEVTVNTPTDPDHPTG